MADTDIQNDPLAPTDHSIPDPAESGDSGVFNPEKFLDAAKNAAAEAGRVNFIEVPHGYDKPDEAPISAQEQFTKRPISLDTFREVLPSAVYLVTLAADRRKHVELDAALDALGYPPVDRETRKGFVTVPPERQEIYDALRAR